MSAVLDLQGKRFGRLVVIGRAQNNKHNQSMWNCLCDCGKSCIVSGGSLMRGTASCGCLLSDITKNRNKTHGMATRSEYNIWRSMKQRCQTKTCKAYPRYGGRGIEVCEDWLSFENFYRDMGAKPTPHHTLDRIDNDGPYSKENCRWATRDIQGNNNARVENASGFSRRGDKFISRICVHGKLTHLGVYENEVDAKNAYLSVREQKFTDLGLL